MYWYVIPVHIALTVKANPAQPNDEREQDRLDLVSGLSKWPIFVLRSGVDSSNIAESSYIFDAAEGGATSGTNPESKKSIGPWHRNRYMGH